MPSIISTKTSGGGGIAVTGDTSGVLELQSNNGTTAVTISTGQVVSFVNNLGTVAGLPSYQCRAWVNFNGTGTVAIRASGNVSSITDNGTGDYTVNFTTAMPDANYSVSGNCSAVNTGGFVVGIANSLAVPTTTSLRILTDSRAAGVIDLAFVNVAIFR
jgi:uncharacterized protein (AIM24 family)